jgi:hypothetical protein
MDNSAVFGAVNLLDCWLQTMRHRNGYGGPVAHWWQSCLLYCGPSADWRYEGIICGYLDLFRKTRAALWLKRAVQAADDLVVAQLPSGKYRNSSFEIGAVEGGTPHEAAADIGLLELAQTLRDRGDDSWRQYFETAERNTRGFLIAELWNGRGFRDQPWNETLVPNKNATTAEVLVLYETLSGHDMTAYLGPAEQVILTAQEKRGPRAGGTVHKGTGRHQLAIGIYTARSACGILRLHEREPSDRRLEWVADALAFLRGLCASQVPFFGWYSDGTPIANPRLIAGAGDFLRAFVWGRKYGLASDADVQFIADLLVRSQLPSGGIPTATGFRWRGDRRMHRGNPDFRDLLPVVGWCDKAFRALAMITPAAEFDGPSVPPTPVHLECWWRGRDCVFHEDSRSIWLEDGRTSHILYQWAKGSVYPETYRL